MVCHMCEKFLKILLHISPHAETKEAEEKAGKLRTYRCLFETAQEVVVLQLEDVLFPVALVHLQAALLRGETGFRCFLFAHERGARGRLRDANSG